MTLITRASDVSSRSIRWAWAGRLAFGYLTVQTGVEGLGKSVFAAWMIARLTRGELPGLVHDKPVNVLVVAGEDGIGDTWRPRLELAGADLDRVGFLNLDLLGLAWNLRDGIGQLHAAVEELDAKVLFVDAALDHMPAPRSGESINSPTFVREALGPLKRLVRDRDLVGLFSMHPPKSRGAAFRDLLQASQAFSAIPRIGLLFDYHPADDASDPDRRRVLVRGKGNLGRDPGALEFRVSERVYHHDDGHVCGREVVTDVAPSEVTLADLAPEKAIGLRKPTKTDAAADLIAATLADGQWHPGAAIREVLERRGLNTESIVTAACGRLNVEKQKQTGVRDGAWLWRLPPEAVPPPKLFDDVLMPSPPRARRLGDDDAFSETGSNGSSREKTSRQPEPPPDANEEEKASSALARRGREDVR